MANLAKKGMKGSLGFQIPRIKFQIKFDMYDPAKYVQEEIMGKHAGGERHFVGIVGDNPDLVKILFTKLSAAKIKYIAVVGDVAGMEKKRKLVCGSTAELLEKAVCILTAFNDVDQCKSLFTEATASEQDTTFIDFSSVDVEMAKELGEMATSNGHVYLDCGLTGMQFRTVEERDTIFVGSNQEHYLELKPMLQTLAHRVRWMGEVGSGRATKSLIDTVQGTYATAVSEALMVADSLGIDAIKMMRNIRITADPDLHRMEDMVADKDFNPKNNDKVKPGEVRKGFKAFDLDEHAASAATVQAMAEDADIDAKVLTATAEQLGAAQDQYGSDDVNAVYLALGGNVVETARGEGEEDN